VLIANAGIITMPHLGVQIITMTSLGFCLVPVKEGIAFNDLKTVHNFGFLSSWMHYGQSKLANIPYARELVRRYLNITTVSVHPGVTIAGNPSLSSRASTHITKIDRLLKPEQGARS